MNLPRLFGRGEGSAGKAGEAGNQWAQGLDKALIFVALVLLSVGLVMVTSASMEVALANYDNAFYHTIRHGVYIALALICAISAFVIKPAIWQKSGALLLLAAFVLLAVVIVPGVGREVNGSMRWLRLGPISIQASELAKLFILIYLAGYLSRRLTEVRSQWSGFLKPMSVLAMMIVLLLLEPDFGAVVVMMVAALGMMFLGGVRLVQFFVLISVSLAAVAVMAVSQPYRMQRLITFMDPWAEENVFDGGYQLTQALIAFGRGEWFGVGIGNSIQKLFYLPEAHTDFVFAILAEETGLLGALLVVALFLVLVFRCMMVGRTAEKLGRFFEAYMAYGVGLMLGAQALINIGVNTGLLPTKGLTLPLLSYGGSSLLVCGMALGIVLRVEYQSRLQLGVIKTAKPGKGRRRKSPKKPVDSSVAQGAMA